MCPQNNLQSTGYLLRNQEMRIGNSYPTDLVHESPKTKIDVAFESRFQISKNFNLSHNSAWWRNSFGRNEETVWNSNV